MENDKIKAMEELGIDVDDALKRFMGNEALFLRMLKKLPDAIAKSFVSPDFDASDYAADTDRAHTIKGVTGILSVMPLYSAYSSIVSLLREGKPEEARAVLKDILPVQEKIIKFIEEMN